LFTSLTLCYLRAAGRGKSRRGKKRGKGGRIGGGLPPQGEKKDRKKGKKEEERRGSLGRRSGGKKRKKKKVIYSFLTKGLEKKGKRGGCSLGHLVFSRW